MDDRDEQHYPKRTMFEDIFTRTNRTLSFYKGKCETLESSCAYYKNELNKAIKKLERLKKSSKIFVYAAILFFNLETIIARQKQYILWHPSLSCALVHIRQLRCYPGLFSAHRCAHSPAIQMHQNKLHKNSLYVTKRPIQYLIRS